MEDRIKLSRIYIIASLLMVVVGIAALAMAFTGDPVRGWANLLLNNVYFLSLAAGALLFVSIQRVTHSGWSAGFIRVLPANDQEAGVIVRIIFDLLLDHLQAVLASDIDHFLKPPPPGICCETVNDPSRS